jgi:hypothetical protein
VSVAGQNVSGVKIFGTTQNLRKLMSRRSLDLGMQGEMLVNGDKDKEFFGLRYTDR